MKLKTLLAVGAIAALAIPTGAIAAKGGSSADPNSGNTRDSATGGGQAFFTVADPAAGPSGAGDTVAFTAHRAKNAAEPDDATGQIQVNRRTGDAPIKFHGTIDCLVTNGEKGTGAGEAYMSGTSRANKNAPAQPFELYVRDGGKGQDERNDFIMLFVGTEETESNDAPEENEDVNRVCGFESFSPADAIDLFRGNVQVRNRDNSADNNPDPGQAPGGASLPALF